MPVLRGHGDCGDVAVPLVTFPLRLAQDVSHGLPIGALCHEAVLRPLSQVFQVEGQVVLHTAAAYLGGLF